MSGINSTINILLADDDEDDCLFFKDAIEELQLPVQVTTIHDGEALMLHLEASAANLPQALFLDMNMPRKNGFECLTEIKNHSALKTLPIIVYSTFYDEEKANLLYSIGVHYYIRKPSDFEELKKVVHRTMMLLGHNKLQAAKENFFINKYKTAL